MKDKIIKLSLIIALLTLLSWPSLVHGQDQDDEQQLEKSSSAVDKEAWDPNGKKAVVEHLENQFGVTEEQVEGLRKKKLGYGEIGIVLSLAKQMPGGITDANIKEILALHQGDKKTGWGKVAQELNLKLGTTIRHMKNIEPPEKPEATNKESGPGNSPRANIPDEFGNSAKGERDDAAEQLNRPERPMMPERLERPLRGRP